MKNNQLQTFEPHPHTTNPALHQGTVRVALVGVGGSGSRLLPELGALDHSLRALGHPGGLDVIAFDPDIVSESNVGRQLFYPADVGQYKAVVQVDRVNRAYGTAWKARPSRFSCLSLISNYQGSSGFDLLITCVDSARARREIHRGLFSQAVEEWRKPCYWLDLGNRQMDGQVILGEVRQREGVIAVSMGAANFTARSYHEQAREKLRLAQEQARAQFLATRLPCVTDLNPEILEDDFQEDDAPSCSLAEALTRQDLFINQHVVIWGMELLWKLFRKGSLEHHAHYINLESGRVNPRLVPSMIPPLTAAKLQVLAGAKAPRAKRRAA